VLTCGDGVLTCGEGVLTCGEGVLEEPPSPDPPLIALFCCSQAIWSSVSDIGGRSY